MSGLTSDIFPYFTFTIRILLAALAVLIVVRCVRSLISGSYESEQWGFLSLPNGARMYLNHWENIIGRAKSSDVCIHYPTLSRSHAAIIRDAAGAWRVYDIGTGTDITVNGRQVEKNGSAPVKTGDQILLGGISLVFVALGKAEERMQAESRTKPGKIIKQGATLFFITQFQILLGLQLCISKGETLSLSIPLGFLALIAVMWFSYTVTRALRRVAFEVESVAFFLSSIGLGIVASGNQADMFKYVAILLAGVLLYFLTVWFLRDIDRVKRLRVPIAVAGMLLLAVNVVFSQAVFGARNWLQIGGVSFQPSEFVKIAFVFMGAATLDRLFHRRNLFVFILYSACCVMALALISDFGTALVFFVAYLLIAYMRSGDLATVFLSVGGAAIAGFLALTMKSHVAARFASWGSAWEHVNEGGYQQVRAMSAAAGGGLFGVGAGNGWLKNIFAADTDMVFGVVCEELGLIVAVAAIAALFALAFFAVKSSATARSSFFAIGACAAVSIMLFQAILNVLGSVDILPFTGVTFPFVSKGGTSLIACWGLLAFVKAGDTRQNASIAIKMPKRQRESDAFESGIFGEITDEEG